jgi:signal transduction histidine kinase
VWTTVQEELADDGTFEVTYRAVTADGTTRWLWERGRVVDPGGDDTEILEGFITDVTERKERERELERRTDDLGSLTDERSRLRQLVEHLLRNAVEHGSTGGERVTVTVGDTADGFYVADDGPGIPESSRDEVFDAGYSTHPQGTGFGLRIVEQVATAHGWTVEMTEGEAGGARFVIGEVY